MLGKIADRDFSLPILSSKRQTIEALSARMAFVLAFDGKCLLTSAFLDGVAWWRVQNWREARQKRFIVGEKLDYDCETQNFSHQHRLLKGESNLIAIKLWKMVFQLFFFPARLLSHKTNAGIRIYLRRLEF